MAAAGESEKYAESGTARPPYLFALVLLLVGLALGIGGILLAIAGGSPLYILWGLLAGASAITLGRGSRWGLWIYGLLLVLLLCWTLYEGGLDPWPMAPRLGLFYLLGLWIALPFARRGLSGGPSLTLPVQRAALAALCFAAIAVPALGLAFNSLVIQDRGIVPGGGVSLPGAGADWSAFGGTMAGARFSTLDRITPDNVDKLKPAWTFRFGDEKAGGLQVTPIKIDDTLYACSGINTVVALDAETGKQRWRYDPKVARHTPFLSCRGVAYYRVPDATGACAERIFTTTVDGRLIGLDARTGRLCAQFGNGGEVSLLEGFGKVLDGYYSHTAAPTIARGLIVLGGTLPDNQYWGEPSGVIRAFDAVSGKLVWAYDVGHPDRTGLPPAGETYTHSTPNNWGQMAYDDSLGLVYVPTGNATPDYFGAQRRPFDEEISSSIMALDIATGRRRWVFQTVHHDLWDYDIGSQPVLFDLPGTGGAIPVLAQATKRGEIFLINRRTGKPLSPVEERPAPQRGAAPEERLSPTQPYPTDMPSLAGGLLNERMMWGLTPFDQLWCRIKFVESRYHGPMTPPGLTPSITYPGFLGGMDWGSISIDPQSGVLVAVTEHLANRAQLYTRKQALAERAYAMGRGREGLDALRGINAMEGTPYGEMTKPFLSPLAVPCQQPPWSRISAIDLKTRKLLWSRPLGTGKEAGPMGLRSGVPIPMGVPALGGVLVTKSGLSFVGASVDKTFRAFDTRTGKQVWQAALPDSAHATPMTYLGRSGRQFIVVAAAGHRSLSLSAGDAIVAYVSP
ncbi:membrane-bound PQQ-dependent dehydrogenase, glucose/quinate/shikimate family [Sphingobium aromaticiconvertens]|uniref:membrane-bound PQQ-dependent dehydrogenase, glucose/quinate/shikimate family n=1 Tax=Sphingobium aromaticiconvertens TaxID=365341 RepID=UPI00301B0F9A